MKKSILYIMLFIFCKQLNGQMYWPIWSHHDESVETITGLSIGTGVIQKKFSDVNGIKIDLPGIGIFLPSMMGEAPFYKYHGDSLSIISYLAMKTTILNDKESNELMTTNGLYLSLTGDAEEVLNGVSVHPIGGRTDILNGLGVYGLIGINTIVNGVSIAALFQGNGTTNGVSIAFRNSTVELNGLQIGLFNKSSNTNGMQIGLWNKNEKRSLPLINWN